MNFARRWLYGLFAAFAGLGCVVATPASAENAFWVSVSGSDSADCSRLTPCRTFAGALTKVPVYGEVRCADSGDFGTISITQGATIDCRAAPAVIAGFPNVPVLINPPTSYGAITVAVRGLVIIGNTSGPGIRVLSGNNVVIDDVTIRHQGTNGIEVVNTAPYITVSISNSHISENHQHGVLVAPPSGNTASVTVSNSTLTGNEATGIRVNDNGFAVVSDSRLTNNGTHGATAASSSAPAVLSLERVVTSFNLNSGALSIGAQATVFLSQVTATGNSYALYPSGGNYRSFGNNRDERNTSPGAVPTPVSQF